MPVPPDFRCETGVLLTVAGVFCCGFFFGGEVVVDDDAFGRLMVIAFEEVIGGG